VSAVSVSTASEPTASQRFLDALIPVVGPLSAIRVAGRAQFQKSGFPTRRNEAWRFTDLKPLIDARFAPVAPSDDLAGLDEAVARHPAGVDRLVFANGRFDPSRSEIGAQVDGVILGAFANWALSHEAEATALFDLAGGAERALLSLNAAFFGDGLVLDVPAGVTLERPVHVLYWNQPVASHIKSLIRLGDGAKATVVQHFAGSGQGWTNLAETVELGAKAHLGLHTLQDEAAEALHTAHLTASIGARAELNAFRLDLGGRLSREDGVLTIAGENAVCGYSGAYLLSGRQEQAVASVIEHAVPRGRTHEVFKGCIADRAHGVFQGKIRVAPDAQKTDGYQLNKTILLGERASIDAKPELEIYADDVKCSHGATVGDLDETALFYLRSRGIPADIARHMLIKAFLVETVELIQHVPTRDLFAAAIADRLAGESP